MPISDFCFILCKPQKLFIVHLLFSLAMQINKRNIHYHKIMFDLVLRKQFLALVLNNLFEQLNRSPSLSCNLVRQLTIGEGGNSL